MPLRITSGRPWETKFKYSRAIRYGNFVETGAHRLLSLPLHINDPAFAAALVSSFLELQSQ